MIQLAQPGMNGKRDFGEKFRCALCGAAAAHWSRRQGPFEQIVLRLFLLRPVRCHDCRERRYVFFPTGWPILKESTFRTGLWVGIVSLAISLAVIYATARWHL